MTEYKTEVGARVRVRGSFERKREAEMTEEMEKTRALPANTDLNGSPPSLNQSHSWCPLSLAHSFTIHSTSVQ